MMKRWSERPASRAGGARWLISVAAIAASLAVAPRAAGQAAAAEALFDQARAALEKGDFETACKRFRESDRLDPAPGTKLNLADCEEKRGKLATAWELFRSAASELPAGDERRPIAEERAKALEPRVPRLVLRLAKRAPKGTQVTLGGATFSDASFGIPLPIDPGEHALVVTAPGHGENRLRISLKEGERKTFEVAPRAKGGAAAAPASGQPAPPPPGPRDDSPARPGGDTRLLGLVIGGVGVAALAGAGITGALTLSARSRNEENCFPEQKLCNQEGRDAASSGETLGALTTGLLVAGVAGLGVGGWLVFTSSDGRELAAVAPGVDTKGGWVSVVRRW